MKPKNIYDELNGGINLSAIHESKKLSRLEKHLLLVIGSEIDFQYISFNELSEKLSISQRRVSAILNGVERRGEYIPGLIEKGYIVKQISTIQQQQKWISNKYCLTQKIFDEYEENL